VEPSFASGAAAAGGRRLRMDLERDGERAENRPPGGTAAAGRFRTARAPARARTTAAKAGAEPPGSEAAMRTADKKSRMEVGVMPAG